MTAEQMRSKDADASTLMYRIGKKLEQASSSHAIVTESISYKKNTQADLTRFHKIAMDSGKKYVSDVFSQEELKEMFWDEECHEAEKELEALGYEVKSAGYCDVRGFIDCDFVVSWQSGDK